MSFCVSPQPASLRTCSGSMFGTMLSASSRSSLAVAQESRAGWVAVEATSRPRQFGYETPQLRLERRLHAGSPYRSNDLVSAGPEPPLSCDLRLNPAADFVSQGSRTSPSPSASVDLAHLRPVR